MIDSVSGTFESFIDRLMQLESILRLSDAANKLSRPFVSDWLVRDRLENIPE